MNEGVRVRFLKDDNEMGVKKGEVIVMSKEGAEMYFNEGEKLIEILENKKIDKKRLEAAKIIKIRNILDDNPKANRNDMVALGYDPVLVDKAIAKEKIDPENEKLVEKYLKRKDIFNYITEKEMDKLIVGEIPTRKVIFLCCQGRLVENCQTASYNLLMSSSAGVGKDYVTSKVLSLLPNTQVESRTRISPTAFTYWHNARYEPEWSWDGKVCYLEDVSDGVLNHEVFKVMTSSGSCATIVIKQRAVDISIKGKPVVITTTATATPIPEIVRRFEFCNLDESVNQTKEIMKRHAEYAKEGKAIVVNEEIIKAMQFLKRKKVKIPFADKLYNYFPENNIMMRTKFVRFLDFIKASCAFHQYQRGEDEEGFLIAQKEDYSIAKKVIEKLSTNRYMIPLTINQQRIMKFFEENPSFVGNSSTILIKTGHLLALKNLINNLNLLVSYGLLEKKIENDSFNRQIELYELEEFLKKSKDVFTLPEADTIF